MGVFTSSRPLAIARVHHTVFWNPIKTDGGVGRGGSGSVFYSDKATGAAAATRSGPVSICELVCVVLFDDVVDALAETVLKR